MAPDVEALKGPSLAVAWDASFSSLALSCLAWPAFCCALVLCVQGRERQIAYLIASASCEAAESGLDCASGRVNVGLEGGGVLVGHDCGVYLFIV